MSAPPNWRLQRNVRSGPRCIIQWRRVRPLNLAFSLHGLARAVCQGYIAGRHATGENAD